MPNRTGEERSSTAMADHGAVDYYAILNVHRSSSSAEIRGAYRTMASAVHPDKHMNHVSVVHSHPPSPSTGEAGEAGSREDNGEEEEKHSEEENHGGHISTIAAERFRLVNEAYEVLSDPDKRAIYDIYGAHGLATGQELARADGPFGYDADLFSFLRSQTTTAEGTSGKSAEEAERQKKFARMKRRAEEKRREALTTYRSSYVFGVSATEAFLPANVTRRRIQQQERQWRRQVYDALRQRGVPDIVARTQALQVPAPPPAAFSAASPYRAGLKSVSLSSSVTQPVTQKDTALFGGSVVAKRGGLGTGSVLAGWHRQVDSRHTAQVNAHISSSQSIATVEMQRVLSPRSRFVFGGSLGTRGAALAAAAGLSTDESAGVGGLTLTSKMYRRLTDHIEGHWTWTVGPGGLMSVGLTRDIPAVSTGTCEFTLGTGLGVALTCARRLGRSRVVRARLHVSVLNGFDFEIGSRQKIDADLEKRAARGEEWANGEQVHDDDDDDDDEEEEKEEDGSSSPSRFVGCASNLSMTGITYKLRCGRGQQRVSVPIFVYPATTPISTALAFILPAAWAVAVDRCALPLYTRIIAARRRAKLALANATALEEERSRAADGARLVMPVAERKMRSALGKLRAGDAAVLVVEAKYGDAEELKAYVAQRKKFSPKVDAKASPSQRAEPRSFDFFSADTNAGAPVDVSPPDEAEAETEEKVEAGGGEDDETAADVVLPPHVLDVTPAVAFLIDGNRPVLRLHGSLRRAGLLGFGDLAPGTSKLLWIRYRCVRSQAGDASDDVLARDADLAHVAGEFVTPETGLDGVRSVGAYESFVVDGEDALLPPGAAAVVDE